MLNKMKNDKTPLDSEWCLEKNIDVGWVSFLGRSMSDSDHPKRMRCEKCKKRFMTFTRECHDAGCFHAYFPKHKKPVKKKKKTSRDI